MSSPKWKHIVFKLGAVGTLIDEVDKYGLEIILYEKYITFSLILTQYSRHNKNEMTFLG